VASTSAAERVALPGQGDLVLADGGRLLATTKVLHDGARAAMLLLPGVFRVDVHSHEDSFEILVRNLSGAALDGGLDAMRHRAATGLDGVAQKVSEFVVTPEDVGPVRVVVTLPASARTHAYTCTAIALVPAGRG
jgi:hypothetical protein